MPQMGALSVLVEDAQDLRRAAASVEGVRNHGGELRRLAGLDQDGPLPQPQHDRSRQDGEPVLAGMDFQLVRVPSGFTPGEAHLGDGDAVRPGLSAQQPGRHAARRIALRPDDHVVVANRLHQLIEGGPEGAGDRGQLVEADPPVAGLDAAEGRGAQEAAGSEIVERPAERDPQSPDPLADQTVEILVLRHTQDHMSLTQPAHRVAGWTATSTSTAPRPPGPWPSSSTSMPRSCTRTSPT